MKRIICILLGILLVFAFVSCDPGRVSDVTEEEQSTANSNASDFVKALNFGQLFVNAFDEEKGLVFSSETASEIIIEFEDYEGEAIKGGSNIEKIVSGSLLFSFSEGLKTPYSAYTVRTESPLMILYAGEETPTAVEFESGSAVFDARFESADNGITGILSDTVQFTKPDVMISMTIGGIEVQYEAVIGSIDLVEEAVKVEEQPAVPVGPTEPEISEEQKKQEASAFFLSLMKTFNTEQFMADILQTHRDIGGVAEGESGTGDTGVANYMEAFKDVSILDLLGIAGGSGDTVLPLGYDENTVFPQGFRFNSLHLIADKEAKSASVTLELEFLEDYSRCFSEDSGFAIKAGNIIYIQLASEEYAFGGYGTGAENIVMPLSQYMVNTGNDTETISSVIVITSEGEKEVSISGLTGNISGEIIGDIQISGPGLEISMTLTEIDAPVPGEEAISIDGTEIGYEDILASFDENQMPEPPAEDAGNNPAEY